MRHHDHDQHESRRYHRGERPRFVRDVLENRLFATGRHRRHADPEHGARDGRRRIFEHGDLPFILLSMIAARPAHGYDLIKALEERMGGGYSPSPGVIYPTLTMLEEQGFTRSVAENGKKLYTITLEGEAHLQASQATVDAIQARIDGIARKRSVELDPRIYRAIENLKMALRLRLSGSPIPDDQARAIAAAIDAAAAEAERT